MRQPPRAVDLVLQGCCLPDGRGPVDIAIAGGRIDEIASSVSRAARVAPPIHGRLVAPAFVDGHVYLDKAFLSEEVLFRPTAFTEEDLLTTQSGEAGGAAMSLGAIERRARRLLRQAVRHGTTALRGVADVYPDTGTSRVELFLRLREEFAPWIDLKILAYPQFGIVRSPGTLDLLREALALGADVLGSVPDYDTDWGHHLDLVFDLAERTGVPLHFSLDHDLAGEVPAESLQVWDVIDRARAAGYGGRVTVGHLVALGSMAPREAARVIEAIQRAEFTVMVFASGQLYRLGRSDNKDARRGLTRVKELLRAGVNVAYASNDVRDAFNPFGNADMLQEGLIVALGAQFGSDGELATVFAMGTHNAARALGMSESYGIEPGKRANLVIFDAPSVAEALRSQAEKAFVLKDGKVVAESTRASHLAEERSA